MKGHLGANPDITGVIASNDDMALGALEALTTAGKQDVKVIGFNGDPDAITAIQSGTLTATALQPIVKVTEAAVAQAVSFLGDGKAGAGSEKQSIDCGLIAKENADKVTAAYTYSG